ncbi:hypothetical protein BV20DRAFT_399620 [Pilatotrama ljubarskyi]|nr:hypothetical protein BV20DRAFT_399620 [Pilatotrama ljubarskyi]
MSILFAPVVVTPLLKVPLLLSNALCTYYGMKPPTPVAQPKERERFAKSDFLGRIWTPKVMVNLAIVLRATLCGLAVAEAAVLLAERLPPSIADRLPSFLSPALNVSSSLFVSPMFLIGSALTNSGGLIRIVCHRTLGRFFSWQLSLQDDHKLITTGPYSVVRHPSYSGWCLLALGDVLSLLSPGSIYAQSVLSASRFGKAAAGAVVGYLAFVTYVLCSRINKEDEVLSKEFGEDWQAWAEKTPYRLIPFVF